jgi:glycosyltransferase involved in cell wall biosynthesis
VEGKNGLLVDADDVNGVYRAIVRLYEDSVVRRKLISKGRITVHEKYDAKRVAIEVEKLYENIYK